MRLATPAAAAAAWKERTMERTSERRARAIVGGLVLIVVGGVALLGRQAGVELGGLVDNGWPFFIIVPGVVLLAAAFVPSPPDGLGFAVAGSVVTTVGAILLYQQSTGNWESWAYVWALIPLAAGTGITVYGLGTGLRDLVGTGVRLVGVAGVLFVVGFWYFNAIFETGENPIDLGSWWPVVLVGIGALVVGRALFTSTAPPRTAGRVDPAGDGGNRP
jgi:hypothetical protein